MRQQKVVVRPGKDVDNGIADAEDVKTSGSACWH
jgi:hypothetical protein